jgi:hypothetical protein
MRPSLSIAALLCLAHSAWAAQFSVVYREGAGRGLSILVAVDVADGSSINEIRVKLPSRLRRHARLGKAPPGWSPTQQGGDVRLSGPQASGRVRIRLDVGDNEPPADLEISVFSGGAVVAREKIRPAATQRRPPSNALENFAILPAVIEPGEQIEFGAVDPTSTPPEGQWTIAGAPAAPSSEGRYTVRIPSDLTPDAAVSAAYVDPWGETIVETAAAQAITVAAPPAFPEQKPRVTGCSRLTFAGQFACVCGNFPAGAQTQLTLDGIALGQAIID